MSLQHNFLHKRDEIKLLMFLWILWTNEWPITPANNYRRLYGSLTMFEKSELDPCSTLQHQTWSNNQSQQDPLYGGVSLSISSNLKFTPVPYATPKWPIDSMQSGRGQTMIFFDIASTWFSHVRFSSTSMPRGFKQWECFIETLFIFKEGREGRLLSFCLESINMNSVLIVFNVNLFAISQRLMLSK